VDDAGGVEGVRAHHTADGGVMTVVLPWGDMPAELLAKVFELTYFGHFVMMESATAACGWAPTVHAANIRAHEVALRSEPRTR
jgi:hypothetical protein